MSLNLSQRPAKLAHLNLRPENHGEERKQAFDVKLTEIPIDSTELGQLLGESEASKRLYVQRESRLEPVFPHLEALKLDGKIEGATVLIAIGLQKKPIRFEECKIAKISIELKSGGGSLLTLTVQTLPAITKEILPLIEANGSEVDVEIYVSQQELFAKGTSDEDEGEDEGERDAA